MEQESKSRVSEKSSAGSHGSGFSDKISNKQTNSEWGWDENSSTNTASSFDNKPAKGALKLEGPKKAPVEDFGLIEEEFAPIEDNSVKPASAYDWGSVGNADDDFFSMATSNIQNTKSKATKSSSSSNRSTPARESPPRNTQSKSKITENQSSAIKQKQSSNSKTGSDVKEVGRGDDFGWKDDGGWNDDSWGSTSESKETEADRKKREREEKRQQRQQELAMKREAKKGGAMKLGVKKAD